MGTKGGQGQRESFSPSVSRIVSSSCLRKKDSELSASLAHFTGIRVLLSTLNTAAQLVTSYRFTEDSMTRLIKSCNAWNVVSRSFPWRNVFQMKDKNHGHVRARSPKESCGATRHRALAVRRGGKSRTSAHSIRLSRESK